MPSEQTMPGIRLAAVAMLALLTALAPGCGQKPVREPLQIAAAADLQVVLPELIGLFSNEYRGPRPVVIYGASGQLARQIEQGAPVDLFLSADRRFVEGLAAKGLVVPGSTKEYTRGVLTLVVHDELKDVVHTLAELADERVKTIALANPDSAPYGRAARETLKTAGLWETLQPKIVLAENVRQAYQFVSSGNADAAFVGSSLAATSTLAAVPVDAAFYEPINQSLGIIRGAAHATQAQEFATFLLTPEAQQIFKNHAFLTHAVELKP